MGEAKGIYLVSCVAKKMPFSTQAKQLYTSPWFTIARDLVEKTGQPWFILSAKYGLLSPDTVVSPYEKTLNTMGVFDRRAWAGMVKQQMEKALPEADELTILAGMRYRENLMEYLDKRFLKVSVPMKGLQIGRQLSWLKHAKSL